MARLTIRHLSYFDSLARTLHFGQAAALAGVSQPALSAQIADMEAHLGKQLFDRSGKGVRLTTDGAELWPKVEHILQGMQELEEGASTRRQPLEGRFRLGVIPTIAPYLLPSLLPRLKTDFPKLKLEIVEAVTHSLIAETLSARLDALVAALPLEQKGLVEAPLFEDRFFLAIHAGDNRLVNPPVKPDHPALEELMLLEEGHCMREQALAVCRNVKPVTMAHFGATSLTTLLQMVSHGLGVTLVPEMARNGATAMTNVRVVPFAEPQPSRSICLAYARNGRKQADCERLAEVLRGLDLYSQE
ncbi:hydrogen peroxide-inducible genes activator [Limoniibacter endophyticus]|uniref:LysR family transcriptional regulator n=1 Tax=Limoniibacter endophyticus TaxID=1565040 RepID=A0A8J3DPC3_9HYPH|nr:hydrogen peroxide-inducible genes activator [Limoniibacter endophyticus]GHC70612.1 LysR family transcriptional regulator [Limoniibacter endophyticus]